MLSEEEVEMKSTGIVRKMDDLGRVCIPIETRKALGIEDRDEIEMYVEGKRIILEKHQPDNACLFCGTCEDELEQLFGKPICKVCVGIIKKEIPF
jgi:transcriptional pleiotropic regulator of transition state genes